MKNNLYLKLSKVIKSYYKLLKVSKSYLELFNFKDLKLFRII